MKLGIPESDLRPWLHRDVPHAWGFHPQPQDERDENVLREIFEFRRPSSSVQTYSELKAKNRRRVNVGLFENTQKRLMWVCGPRFTCRSCTFCSLFHLFFSLFAFGHMFALFGLGLV